MRPGHRQAPLALRREHEYRAQMFGPQAWKIVKNIGFAHTARQVFKDIVNGNAGSLDAGFSAPNIGVDNNELVQICHEPLSLIVEQFALSVFILLAYSPSLAPGQCATEFFREFFGRRRPDLETDDPIRTISRPPRCAFPAQIPSGFDAGSQRHLRK
jgi:hypothetical protein